MITATITLPGSRTATFSTEWTSYFSDFSITEGSSAYTGWVDLLQLETHAASDYGVTTPGSAAVVVTDDSSNFTIKSVRLRSPSGCFDRQYGRIRDGETGVYPVPTGLYAVEVTYTASAGSLLCESTEYGWNGAALESGGAAVYSLTGGGTCGVLYTPPDLEKL